MVVRQESWRKTLSVHKIKIGSEGDNRECIRVPASYRIISKRFPMNGMLDFAKGGSFMSSCEALELMRDKKKTAKRRVTRMKTPLLLFKARTSGSGAILVVKKDPACGELRREDKIRYS